MSEAPSNFQFALRLPQELRAKIKQSADVNRRSMNAEIVVRLERTISETETKKADATA